MTDAASPTWADMVAANPEHSKWYIERFKEMERQGDDLHGEARLIDAIAPRGAHILDAGCGPGRVGGRLSRLGHTVTGVDLDPILIEEASSVYPDVSWVVADLETMDLTSTDSERDFDERGFDVVVSAGNVVPFIRAQGRRGAVGRMAHYTAGDGRLVIGFGAGRGYTFEDFLNDASAEGMKIDQLASTWDLRPLDESSDFIVAILSHK